MLTNNIVDISGISHQGKGVGRLNDKVVFIENALPGEKVVCEIVKNAKNFSEAKATNIIVPSNARIKPLCKYFDECGGCAYQHCTYEEEVRLKTLVVRQTLQKIGQVNPELVADCIPSGRSMSYRNKMQYHVKKHNGKLRLGFIGKDNIFLPIVHCLLAEKEITLWAEIIEEYLPEGVTRVIIRKSYPDNKLLCLFLSPQRVKLSNQAIQEIMAYPGASAIFANITFERTPQILGRETYKLAGTDFLEEQIGNLRYAVGPTSFFQVNPYQTENLFEIAKEMIIDDKQEIIDFYCGVGSFTLFSADKAKKIYGMEIVEEAVKFAKFNAELNNISNANFFAGDVSAANRVFTKEAYDLIIADPPRHGCDRVVLDFLAQKTNEVVYVSCESSTLARDIKVLKNYGFEVKKVIPVDMFPRTSHVECIVSLKRKHSE